MEEEVQLADRQDAGDRRESQKNRAAGTRPEIRQSSRSASGRPEVRQSSKAAGSRPSGAHSASSRPKSATAVQKTRTSTGRPLEKGRTDTAGNKNVNRNVNKNVPKKKNTRPSAGGKAVSKKRKQSSNVVLNAKAMFIAAAVVGLVLALIVTMIMRANMLKVRQIEKNYNIGDAFAINNYFEAASKDTVLEYDTSDFAPDELGTYKVKFTVRRGKMSKRKTGKINVVDEVKPYISGPEEIEVKVGQEINWSDYYTVTDEDPDIQSKLKSVNEIDTGKARAVSATLTVTDWAGNTSTKSITVMVVEDQSAN